MIEITPLISIDENGIKFDYIRSSGPGGQNVNKVATGVQLRYNVELASELPDEVRSRLRKLAGKRINDEGYLVIEAKRFRTQEQNREDAVARLIALIIKAAEKPKPRKTTKPSLTAQTERIDNKKHRGAIKRLRRSIHAEFE